MKVQIETLINDALQKYAQVMVDPCETEANVIVKDQNEVKIVSSPVKDD